MWIFYRVFLLSLCILMAACSVKTGKEEPPLWYFEHMQDYTQVYGYGSARSKEGARIEALRDLQMQLRLKVQSQMQLSKQQHNDFSFTIPDSIFITIPEINLNRVQISKEMEYESIYYVRVQISKESLLEEFQNEYDKHLEALERISHISCDLHMRDLMLLQTHLKDVGRLGAVIEVFGGKRSNTQKYYQLLQKTPVKSPLHLYVKIDDERYIELLQKTLKKEIGKIYKISSKAKNSIHVDVQTKQGENGTVLSMNVVLKDCEDHVVFQTKITAANGSKGLYEGVRLAINKVTHKLIEELKIWSAKKE